MSVTKRILLIGNKADMALKFRLEMIQSWRDLNHEVHVAAPNMTDSVTADALHALGVKTHDFALNRVGQNPRQELRALLSLPPSSPHQPHCHTTTAPPQNAALTSVPAVAPPLMPGYHGVVRRRQHGRRCVPRAVP